MAFPPLAAFTAQTTDLEIKSILLVTDDPEVSWTLKAFLEEQYSVVTVVETGAAALREVVALDFDVIICDLLMPHMPGNMFYLAVSKAKPELAKRFVFIAGHSEDTKVNAFLKQVDAVVLFKPVLPEDLSRMISLVSDRINGERMELLSC